MGRAPRSRAAGAGTPATSPSPACGPTRARRRRTTACTSMRSRTRWSRPLPTSAPYRLLDTDINAAHERDRARSMGPDALIALIEASGLRGRGGAGFPLAKKLAAARTAAARGAGYSGPKPRPPTPGRPLARTILLKKPDLVIEGL